MAVEYAEYVAQLDPLRPTNDDPLGEADDHFRLLKRVLQSTLAGSSGDAFDVPLTVGPRRLNELAGAIDLSNLCTLSGTQTIAGAKTFTQPLTSNQLRRADLDGSNIIGVDGGATKVQIGGTGSLRHDVVVNCSEPLGNGQGGLAIRYQYDGGWRTSSVLTEHSSQTILDAIYPVGSVIITADNLNPGARWAALGATSSWVADCTGRMLAGAGTTTDASGSPITVAGGEKGGSASVKLSVANLPPHTHTIPARSNQLVEDASGGADSYPWQDPTSGQTKATNSTGSGTAFNVTNPYHAFYIWRRTE